MAAPSFRLAADARPFAGPPNGYTTYLTSIIEPLLEAGWEIVLLTNRPLRHDYACVERCRQEVFGPLAAWRWEQLALPGAIRRHHPQVYFAPANRGVPVRSVAPTRTVLAVLDVIPFKFPRSYAAASRFHFVRRELGPELSSVGRANALVTISKASAADIRRYLRRSATPLLIRLPARRRTTTRTKQDQFVYLGGVDPRKRVANLLRAFANFAPDHPSFKLVLLGRGYERFLPLCRDLDIAEQVELPGFVSEAEKMKVLGASRALVYPSLYEGYGLAIAEGFQAGVPVIAGAGGAQAEIGGDAVIYVNPNNPADIARAMHDVLQPAEAKRLVARGAEQLERLTDPEVGAQVVRFFTQQAELARTGAR